MKNIAAKKNPATPFALAALATGILIIGAVLYFNYGGGDDGDGGSVVTGNAVTDSAVTGSAVTDQSGQNAADGTAADTGTGADAIGINQASVRPDGSAVIAGTAPPGAVITLFRDGNPIGRATADANGDWVIIPDKPLPPGDHLLHAEITDADGNVQPGSRALVVQIPAGRDEAPLVVLVPYGDVDVPAKILQAPDKNIKVAAPGAPFVTIRVVKIAADGIMQVAGRASGGAGVAVTIGGNSSRGAVLGGLYETRLAFDAAAKQVVIRAALEGCDARQCRARVRVQRGTLEKALAGDSLLVIEKGDVLWNIAYRNYGSGFRFVHIFRNNAEQIKDPDLIYPDQIFAIPDKIPAGAKSE